MSTGVSIYVMPDQDGRLIAQVHAANGNLAADPVPVENPTDLANVAKQYSIHPDRIHYHPRAQEQLERQAREH